MNLLVSGYASIDHIMRVDYAPRIGETGILLHPPNLDKPTLGGCASDVAIACAHLGLTVHLVSIIGDDVDGQWMLNTLQQAGVKIDTVNIIADRHTAHTFLFVNPENQHQVFYYAGAGEMPNVTLPALPLVQWGVITAGNADRTYGVAQWLKNNHIPIVWSHKDNEQAFPPDLIRYLAQVSQILILNEHEAQVIQHIMGVTQLSDLLHEQLQSILLTQGESGCLVITNEEQYKVPAIFPTQLVDTTGAGDAFTAGVVWGLNQQLPLRTCVQVGTVMATCVLEAWGSQTGLPAFREMTKRYEDTYGKPVLIT